MSIDCWYYGRFTCPQFNFVKFNVIDDLASFFGRENWFYYIQNLKDLISNNILT